MVHHFYASRTTRKINCPVSHTYRLVLLIYGNNQMFMLFSVKFRSWHTRYMIYDPDADQEVEEVNEDLQVRNFDISTQ